MRAAKAYKLAGRFTVALSGLVGVYSTIEGIELDGGQFGYNAQRAAAGSTGSILGGIAGAKAGVLLGGGAGALIGIGNQKRISETVLDLGIGSFNFGYNRLLTSSEIDRKVISIISNINNTARILTGKISTNEY